MSYNGWKNWETWNVALWAGNDEPVYLEIRHKTHEKWIAGNLSGVTAKDAEAWTREIWPDGTPDFTGPKQYDEVDWEEIAELYDEF